MLDAPIPLDRNVVKKADRRTDGTGRMWNVKAEVIAAVTAQLQDCHGSDM